MNKKDINDLYMYELNIFIKEIINCNNTYDILNKMQLFLKNINYTTDYIKNENNRISINDKNELDKFIESIKNDNYDKEAYDELIKFEQWIDNNLIDDN